jgi:hypothetical protein
MAITMTLYKSDSSTNVRTDLNLVSTLLEKLQKEGKLNYKIIDTSKFSDSELDDHYGKAIMPSVWNKYRIRTVFGTNRNSGCFFGKEQPALLIEGDIWEIYPHEKDGKKITIEKFLSGLAKSLQ